jgi:hypothetical protein
VGIIFSAIRHDIEKNRSERLKKLRKYFNEIPMVDLGAGITRYSYLLARYLGAKGYIAVEPHKHSMLEPVLVNLEDPSPEDELRCFDDIEEAKKIPFAVAAEDMLTFLKRLPDHSVGILSSGTDSYVMYGGVRSDEDRQRVDEYIQSVIKEIARVLHPQSVLLSTNSIIGTESGKLLEKSEEDSFSGEEPYQGYYYVHKIRK